MRAGLQRILELIRVNPDDTLLVDRFLILAADLIEGERADVTLTLSEALLRKNPRRSIELAHMVYRFRPGDAQPLEIMAEGMDNLGRYGKATVIRQQIKKVKEARETTPDVAKSIIEDSMTALEREIVLLGSGSWVDEESKRNSLKRSSKPLPPPMPVLELDALSMMPAHGQPKFSLDFDVSHPPERLKRTTMSPILVDKKPNVVTDVESLVEVAMERPRTLQEGVPDFQRVPESRVNDSADINGTSDIEKSFDVFDSLDHGVTSVSVPGPVIVPVSDSLPVSLPVSEPVDSNRASVVSIVNPAVLRDGHLVSNASIHYGMPTNIPINISINIVDWLSAKASDKRIDDIVILLNEADHKKKDRSLYESIRHLKLDQLDMRIKVWCMDQLILSRRPRLAIIEMREMLRAEPHFGMAKILWPLIRKACEDLGVLWDKPWQEEDGPWQLLKRLSDQELSRATTSIILDRKSTA